MAPDWLAKTIQDFGIHLGLSNFRLNERDAAGVRFENGISLRFEYHENRLFLFTSSPMKDAESQLLALLQAANHLNQLPFPVRVAYQSKASAAVFLIRLQEQEVDIPTLNRAFQCLWQLATHFLNP